MSEVLFFCALTLALTAVVYCARLAYREASLLEAAKGNAQAFTRWAEGAGRALAAGKAFAPQACSALALPPPPPAEFAAGILPEGTAAEARMPGAASAPATAAAHVPPVRPPEPQGGQVIDEELGQVEVADPPGGQAAATPSWGRCRAALLAAGGALARLVNPFDPRQGVLGVRCEPRSAAARGQVVVEKGAPPPAGAGGGVAWGPLEAGEPIARGLMLRVLVCDADGRPAKVSEVML